MKNHWSYDIEIDKYVFYFSKSTMRTKMSYEMQINESIKNMNEINLQIIFFAS